uniref:C1q domain-containing protein n=2 Tax=Scophthalmus maximus TaxID=52904 RepID=A0A8D3DUH7_SCOMX
MFCGPTLATSAVTNVDSDWPVRRAAPACRPDGCDLLREKVAALENEVKQSRQEIEELRSKEQSPVMFSAAMDGVNHDGPFHTDTTLIYSKLFTAYNQFTGIFTAPVSGVYYFPLFYHAGGDRAADLMLFKNNELVLTTSDHRTTHDGADNGGNAALLQLQQGDQMFVGMKANTHVWQTLRLTPFSGFCSIEVRGRGEHGNK